MRLSVLVLGLLLFLPPSGRAETDQELRQRVERLQSEVDSLKAQLSSRQPASGTPQGLATEDLQNKAPSLMNQGNPSDSGYPQLNGQLLQQLQNLQNKQQDTQKFLLELEKEM